MTWSRPASAPWAILVGAMVCFSFHCPAHGQGTATLSTEHVASTEVIEQGLQLEQDRRWSDAILLYEKATKRFPEDADLRRRLLISRIHYDVNRRYRDTSFRDSVHQLTAEQANELYSEVLMKLEMNYVDPVNLGDILRNGTAFLEVALTESAFLNSHLAGKSATEVEEFRRNIHRSVLGRTVRNRFEARQVVSEVAQMAEQQLGLRPTATIYEYICGAVGLLDPYSSFLTPGELREMMSQIEGNFVGLGVELRPREDRLEVVSVIRGGPAEKGGLRGGDLIRAVDQTNTTDVGADRAADMLRGVEGTFVRLTVQNSAPSSPMREIRVRRERVEVPSVEAPHLIDREFGVGYVRIANFQKTTDQELDRALWSLQRQGMRSLILDVRGNPGGLLDAAVRVADRFIADGFIVKTRGRNGLENQNFSAQRSGTWQMPLVVLIDGDSASASEILAGAIRDHGRGKLIGQTTYGKGSVQGLFNTDTAESGLRLTVSKFFSPLDRPISFKGVSPDIEIDAGTETGLNGSTEVTVAKPVIGSDGAEVLDPQTSSLDRALQSAVDHARRSIRTAAK